MKQSSKEALAITTIMIVLFIIMWTLWVYTGRDLCGQESWHPDAWTYFIRAFRQNQAWVFGFC